jgi:hypothetical protein
LANTSEHGLDELLGHAKGAGFFLASVWILAWAISPMAVVD